MKRSTQHRSRPPYVDRNNLIFSHHVRSAVDLYRKRLVQIAIIVLLGAGVAGCDNLSAQDRAMVNELQAYFDFEDYRSAEQAEAALKERFPRFDQTHYASYESPEAATAALAERAGEAVPLLAYLDKVATKIPGRDEPKKSHRKVAWVHPSAPQRSDDYFKEDTEARLAEWNKNLIPVDAYVYTMFSSQDHGNNTFWVIWLIVSKEGVVLDSEARLTYMDENFAKRGIPFRLVNARDAGNEWIRKVLFSLLGDDITPTRVDKLMMEGGADWKKVKENKEGNIDRIYYFDEGESRIQSMIFGVNRKVVISWTFNPNGRFQELYITGDQT